MLPAVFPLPGHGVPSWLCVCLCGRPLRVLGWCLFLGYAGAYTLAYKESTA